MKKNKVIAALLIFVMLLTLAPTLVVAAPSNPDVVRSERVYIAMAAASEGSTGFVLGTSDSGMAYREYAHAYWLDGDAPTVKAPVRTTTDFPLTGTDSALGAYNPPNFIGAGIYLLGFNAEGIAVEFEKLPFDPYTSYGAPDPVSNTIRIGNWGINDEGNIYNTFKYDANTKVYFVTGTNAELALDDTALFEDLTEDWNDVIRIFYDDDRVLTEVYITAAAGTGTRPAADQNIKWYYSEGVRWNDPDFGYDGVENPYPVQFALYNPIKDVTNLGAGDPDALYPLYVFCHGSGGGGSKTGIVSADVTPYITVGDDGYGGRQGDFQTAAAGVTGAYVMAARANEFVNTGFGGPLPVSWLHGYKKDGNPRYAAGDENYKGKPTQCDALIMDILWLIANENVDPDRIYLVGNSAGGYMAFRTLFESERIGHGDLFAAVVPNVAALFPEGVAGNDWGEPSHNGLGMQGWLESVKDVPIWAFYGANDNLCTPQDTFRAPFAVPGINGSEAWYQSIASLSDGVSPIQGSPLTRVTIVNGMAHASDPIRYNNVYQSGANAGLYYSQEISAAAGRNEQYSSGSYEETLISWLNTCGYAQAKKVVSVSAAAFVEKLNGNQNRLWITVTELHRDGTSTDYEVSVLISNNAAGTYSVGDYNVYVDTKGNDQVRACEIVG